MVVIYSQLFSESGRLFGHVTKLILYIRPISFSQCVTLERSTLSRVAATCHYRQLSSFTDAPNVLQPVNKTSSTAFRIKKISKAMRAYLERAKRQEDFMAVKTEEFEIGKHHLANMMGVEVGAMTQQDIDKAIQYLLPSGLYEPKARPMMKPAEEMFPKEKSAQFNESGRPFSPFFYTRKANFYQAMHDIIAKFHELDAFEDRMIRKGISEVPKENLLDLSGSEWLSYEKACSLFLEKLTEDEYTFMIDTLTRLAAHPYSFRCKDHIWKFRKDFPDVSNLESIPELMYDENGRPFMVSNGFKKRAKSEVTVWGNGTGKVTINGRDIGYFPNLQDREQIMFPVEYCDMLGKVDIEATVQGSGMSSQANSIRYGVAMCLRSFVSVECCEKMRLAGLLTVDRRYRERKKPGQKGARAKHKFVKR